MQTAQPYKGVAGLTGFMLQTGEVNMCTRVISHKYDKQFMPVESSANVHLYEFSLKSNLGLSGTFVYKLCIHLLYGNAYVNALCFTGKMQVESMKGKKAAE